MEPGSSKSKSKLLGTGCCRAAGVHEQSSLFRCAVPGRPLAFASGFGGAKQGSPLHPLDPAAVLAALVAFLLVPSPRPASADTLDDVRRTGVLTWGADAIEGGAPYVFRDPQVPDRYIGFEVDLAEALAREFGVRAEFRQNAWDALVPGLKRGDYAVVMNGLEITEDRAEAIAFSKPYYVAAEQLAVRRETYTINSLADLKGRKVGTLKASLAERILQGEGGIEVRSYDGQGTPYLDLAGGRLDAVLMDTPIALYYAKPNPELKLAGAPISEARYGIGIRKEDAALLDAVNHALDRLARAGTLRAIYERWGIWNETTARYLGDERPGTGPAPDYEAYLRRTGQAPTFWTRLGRYAGYLPDLLEGAKWTLVISVLAMAMAIALGIALAVARLYGPGWLSRPAWAYVELVRGTPLLIQLYLIYYGLPNLGVRLDPFVAGVLGLGLNYAAYEAENYRAGLQSVAGHQLEAALSLGLRRGQAVRYVILPQAVRVVIPPVTNDFIALLKDSSIVSVITIVELTRKYYEMAGENFDYLGIGLLAAGMYFFIGLPFAWLARRLERRIAVYVR